jgi:hypothetical protein
MPEYRVYYKDRENKTWEEWYEPAGFTSEEAEKTKQIVEAIPTTYDVEIRTIEAE